ncbi:MAG: hypothetical protein HFJ84_03590 [Clostridiales bacterium]|nr:hypothetical protein [Clostridiales bacterium]
MKKNSKAKKALLSLCLAASLCAAVPLSASAAAAPQEISQSASVQTISTTVEYFSDGSYLTTEIQEVVAPQTRATYTKSGQKTLTFRDSNGKILWTYVLAANFTVNPGVSATCTSASGTPVVYASDWSLVSHKPSRSGNKASATVTMQRKVLGNVVETKTETTTLTCDKNGNLS